VVITTVDTTMAVMVTTVVIMTTVVTIATVQTVTENKSNCPTIRAIIISP
jgi:hypothetical protein